MLKNMKLLALFLCLLVSCGCQTVKGFGQDVHNLNNPDQNGWDAIQKADAWFQQNLW